MKLIRKTAVKKVVFGLAGLALGLPSCAYRFSNSFQKTSRSIRSICVEAIFPAAKDVLPYHYLWEAVQRRIALDGSFVLDDCENAEAILVSQVVSGAVKSEGEILEIDKADRDPEIYDPVSPEVAKFRRLEAAKEITKDQQIDYQLKIEVFDLRTRASLFSKYYARTEKFPVKLAQPTIQLGKEFIVSDESIRNRSRSIGNSFASELVSDLRSKLSMPRAN